jgi:hypothetical protein
VLEVAPRQSQDNPDDVRLSAKAAVIGFAGARAERRFLWVGQMAKYKTDPIASEDLEEFINTKSDFGFEMKVLHTLRDLQFLCHHGGTYDDPVTGRPRQFDIRARWTAGTNKCMSWAVECKQLRNSFPLLVSRVPRTVDESFANLIHASDAPSPSTRSNLVVRKGNDSPYPVGDQVGKSTEQVGRTLASGELSNGGDSEIYSKWSQALSSVFDLAHDEALRGWTERGWQRLSLICPVVVVPDGTLWVADFDDKGNLAASPTAVDCCDYYVDKLHRIEAPGKCDLMFKISHIQFSTISGLATLHERLRKYMVFDA